MSCLLSYIIPCVMSYHISKYHIISYHIISYHICFEKIYLSSFLVCRFEVFYIGKIINTITKIYTINLKSSFRISSHMPLTNKYIINGSFYVATMSDEYDERCKPIALFLPLLCPFHSCYGIWGRYEAHHISSRERT